MDGIEIMARSAVEYHRPFCRRSSPSSTSILLEPLTDAESDRLIENLLGHASLAEEPRARVSRTLRTWVCAGAPIPRILVQRAKAEMNLDVLSCWGMTENAGLTITRKSEARS